MNLPFSNPGAAPGDPGSAFDSRPTVALRRHDRSAWWFAGSAVVAALLLFMALEARRQGTEQAASESAGPLSYAAPEAIPDLVMPTVPAEPAPAAADAWPQPSEVQQRPATPLVAPQRRASVSQPNFEPQRFSAPYQEPVTFAPPQAAPAIAPNPEFDRQSSGPPGIGAAGTKRIIAGRLENPATTVVQGTLINAVLETALDSTRPGQTRAIVTRDIFGFDGTRLLIPRGTRLYGVYAADVSQGQKRAQIRWTRLLRPDGVSLALDSPAADPLGRAGVGGKVNNHFIQRLGNALIGTTANLGSALVTRSISSTSPVVVAVPGATQTASQAAVPSTNQIAPTLTVRQGTRITVFVQHDLDFTSVEEGS